MTPANALRRGWTTGSCATAAAKAAWSLLVTGECPDPVMITLPGGDDVAFALNGYGRTHTTAWACVIKDAGDDPDVTNGALIYAQVERAAAGAGVVFRAGDGVGTVTRPGLPIPPGEPAINPVPRAMIRTALDQITTGSVDVIVTLSIKNGKALAARTLNARLGILGGLSILGTTGIVVPFSCSAWIHSIHRGIDVARALNLPHIAGSTGSTSEKAVQKLYALADTALIEMGDFAGGMLKYLHRHPVARVTIAGGIAKMTKLAQGHLDLHSSRSLARPDALVSLAEPLGLNEAEVQKIKDANTVAQAYAHLGNPQLGALIAQRAAATARSTLQNPTCLLDVVIFDRDGKLLARSPIA